MTNLVDPNLVNEGEWVMIQDKDKNRIEGVTELDDEGRLMISAFGIDIVFARWSKSARNGLGGYTCVKGVKIIGHQGMIDQLVFDVVPKQKFKGGNPT